MKKIQWKRTTSVFSNSSQEPSRIRIDGFTITALMMMTLVIVILYLFVQIILEKPK